MLGLVTCRHAQRVTLAHLASTLESRPLTMPVEAGLAQLDGVLKHVIAGAQGRRPGTPSAPAALTSHAYTSGFAISTKLFVKAMPRVTHGA